MNPDIIVEVITSKNNMLEVIDHYKSQGTIPTEEATRLIDLSRSPDEESQELVKVILEQRYKIL